MRYLLHLLSVATMIFLLTIPTISSAQEGISFFEGSWEKMLAEAKAKNKPVFVDCYTSWCMPCKMLEKNIFPDKNVSSFYNENFINYRIDMEKGEGPDLAKRYQVLGYPTLLFVDASGNLLHQNLGSMDADGFIALGKVALDPTLRLSGLDEKYKQGEKSDEFILGYAEMLLGVGKKYRATEVIDAWLAEKKESELFKKENWDLITKFLDLDPKGKIFNYVYNNRAAFEKKIGDEEVREYLKKTAFTGIYKVGKEKDAETFNKVLLPIIENSSTSENKEGNVLKAKKQFYREAQDWSKYAETAVQYMNNGYYKSKTKHRKELDAMLTSKKMSFDEYIRSSDANALNGEAWSFYQNVDDPEMLKASLKWIETSVQLHRSYFNLDTYAALLFKLGDTDKAMEVANEAIAEAEKDGLDATSTKELVEKYTGAGE